MNNKVFKAFVDVIQAVDLSDDIKNVRPAMNKLNKELKSAGYKENMTWEDALRKALSG